MFCWLRFFSQSFMLFVVWMWNALPRFLHLNIRFPVGDIVRDGCWVSWCFGAGPWDVIPCPFFLLSFFLFFIRYFLHIHFKCYPESSLYPPPTLLPYPPTPASWPWHFPVLGHIKFAIQRGLSSQWWPTRPSSATYAARGTSSGGTG